MKKFLIIIPLLFLFIFNAQAQQDSRYSQYVFNGLRLNPAYAGIEEDFNITGIYRNQWSGIDDGPKSFALSMHDVLGKQQKVGLGLFLEHDRIGVDSRTTLYGSYAYRIKFNNGDVLSTGLQGGFMSYQSALTEITTPEEGVDIAFSENISRFAPNFGAGIYYESKGYYLGVSIPHLLAYKFTSEKETLHDNTRLKGSYREYLFTGGLTLTLNKNIQIKPSILVQYIPATPPVEISTSAFLVYQDELWLGLTYRSNEIVKPESISFQVFYQMQNGMKLGYAYDHTFAPIGYYTAGTHEFLVGVDLGKKSKPNKLPRK